MIHNTKISLKVGAVFFVLSFIVVAFCTIVFRSIGTTESVASSNRTAIVYLETIDGLLANLVEQQNALRGYVASADPQFVDRIRNYSKEGDESLANLTPMIDAATSEMLKRAKTTFEAEVDQAVKAAANPDELEQVRHRVSSIARLTKVREILGGLEKAAKEARLERVSQQSAAFLSAKLTLAIGGLLTIILSAMCGLFLNATIVRPLSRITAMMQRLALGEKHLEVPATA